MGAPCAAVALNWLFVRNMIVHAPDFIRVVERYFLVLLAVAGLWFASTGNLIVTTYVVPGLCMLALAFNAVLLIAFRGSFVTATRSTSSTRCCSGSFPWRFWPPASSPGRPWP
ncbi:MAG: hypothetical protein ACLUW6_02655 [Coriobacteriaceae bacterium]